jgi:hypothetical protein
MSANSLDKEAVIQRFDTAFCNLISMLSSIDQDQFNAVPFEGSWTPGRLGEHILKSAINTPKLLNGPTIPTERVADERVAWIEEIFLNYDNKMQAPDFIVPEVREYNKTEMISTLENIRKEMIATARSLDLSEICTAFELPNSGKFTRYEWISFVAIHVTRHNHQLRNIIAKLEEKVA